MYKEFAIAMKMATTAKVKDFKSYIMSEPSLQKKTKTVTKKDASKLKRAFQWLLKKK